MVILARRESYNRVVLKNPVVLVKAVISHNQWLSLAVQQRHRRYDKGKISVVSCEMIIF